ncbi:transferrin receptor 1 [Pelobates cultripes]|uniref:Transferrin receptor protein 1 n=1 Tax=Pelobates cultripes TaxID=61616 RepID=A0AAD1VTV1_PELCU|nr:transferrin receptor 1 [Pelobates cultripes]
MEKVRSSVTNFFGRVPLSYTRFSLTQQTDGDASQVEMKLADDEECGDQAMVEHVVKPRNGNNHSKSLCFKILFASLIFLIGFLIGYLSYRGRSEYALPKPKNDHNGDSDDLSDPEVFIAPETLNILYWGDLRSMLETETAKSKRVFTDTIKKWSEKSSEAEPAKEESVANWIHDEFSNIGLDKVWNDEHYVRLQDAGSSLNKVTILKNGQEVIKVISPTTYVAYSPSTSKSGGLVYCHYGRKEDFITLSEKNVNVTGNLVLVRSGLISLSEKVKNAEFFKAIGVLIYPEPSDFAFPDDASQTINAQFGHAHFGTGDPYTPGFPSFNHTQFPPSESSGLPKIPVQTISSDDGKKLLEFLDGVNCPSQWQVQCMLGPKLKEANSVTLEINNVLAEKKIYNIFGFLRGFDEPDRYVIVGAQRDAKGPGVAKAAVGTSLLLEVARIMRNLVKNEGYKPRRSIVFASWGAGEFGSVGATEWLEGYLTTLHTKAIAYINLDSTVQGSGTFRASASPLMYSILKKTMNEVNGPASSYSLSSLFNKDDSKFEEIIVPFSMEDAAYPFIAYSGIPSASFSFQKDNKSYAYIGTEMDTFQNLQSLVDIDTMCSTVTQIAGQIILRLTHDHKLPLDYDEYNGVLLQSAMALSKKYATLREKGLSIKWIYSSRGDFKRASDTLTREFTDSDTDDKPMLRSLNDRIMKVEHNFLSPYVSPKDTPFRHIIYGSGNHTFTALMEHLNLADTNRQLFDEDLFRNQLALFTWTIQGAANALSGEIWDIDNEF